MPLLIETDRDQLLDGERRSLRIDTLEALDQEVDPGSAPEDIFANVSAERVDAARKTLGFLAAGVAEPPFLRLARYYVVDRNTGYHGLEDLTLAR